MSLLIPFLLFVMVVTNASNYHDIKFRISTDNNSRHEQPRHILSATGAFMASSSLPRSDGSIAVAIYNNSIFLFGGDIYAKQFVKFDVISNNITDYGAQHLSFNAYGNSQYYTQIGEMFYWIDPNSQHNRINVYDFQTKQITQSPDKMLINVGVDGCLASHKELLFVVGGVYHSTKILNKFQIFNMSSSLWMYGPDMRMARKQHSCLVCNQTTLYAIGGTDDQIGAGTVEKISISVDNITNTDWVDSSPLPYALLSSRAILYGDTILVIGGFAYNYDVYNVIQSINCLDTYGTVTIFSPSLQDKIYATAAVTFSHTIFAFGGYNGMNVLDDSVASWQYIQLPTTAPTTATPTMPTMSPTTAQPTDGTTAPTIGPTDAASLNPTLYPSNPTPEPVTLIDRDPTKSPGTESVALSTSLMSTPLDQSIVDGGNPNSNPFLSIVVVAIVALILFAVIVVFNYIKHLHKKKPNDCYVELIGAGNGSFGLDGMLTPTAAATKDVNTRKVDITMQRFRENIININDDASSVFIGGSVHNDDDDDVYKYAAPTQDPAEDAEVSEVQTEGINVTAWE